MGRGLAHSADAYTRPAHFAWDFDRDCKHVLLCRTRRLTSCRSHSPVFRGPPFHNFAIHPDLGGKGWPYADERSFCRLCWRYDHATSMGRHRWIRCAARCLVAANLGCVYLCTEPDPDTKVRRQKQSQCDGRLYPSRFHFRLTRVLCNRRGWPICRRCDQPIAGFSVAILGVAKRVGLVGISWLGSEFGSHRIYANRRLSRRRCRHHRTIRIYWPADGRVLGVRDFRRFA